MTQSGASATNYTFQYESGTLTVTKAPLTMVARDKKMEYGDPVPGFDVDYYGLVNSEAEPEWTTAPIVATTATSESDAGTYPITISGGEARNYDVKFQDGLLTISKASLIATTKDASRLYGDDNPDFELKYEGLKNNETTPAWAKAPTFATPATKTSPVGQYGITATGEAKNYVIQFMNTGKLTVTKAMLTATARSYTRRQYENNPKLEVDYDGFKNDENKIALTEEPIATTTATLNSKPGTYPITVSGGIAMNYEFTYVDGTLTIIPRDDPGDPTANVLTVDNLVGNKGSQCILPIAMTNDKSITGVQIDLYLPQGVTVATNDRGKMLISTTNRMTGNYTLSSSQMDGFVRILGYSSEGDAFTGTSGDILNVTLDISSSMTDGDYDIKLKDIVLSDVNNTELHPADVYATLTIKNYTVGDVDNSGTININDVVCIINYILGRQVGTFIPEAADVDDSGKVNINDVVTLINLYILNRTNARAAMARSKANSVETDNYLYLDRIDLKPGETKEVELMLTNTGTVAAAQGNIKLPEGLSFVTKGNGRPDVRNVDSRSEDYTLSCAIQDDGSMTFAHYSPDGYTYMGNSGGIFTFKIQAAEDAKLGTYEVKLSGVVLSIDGVGIDIPDRTSVLNVIDSNADPQNGDEFTYNGIKYTVVSRADQTVEVAASKQSAGSDGVPTYRGDIEIPSTVSNRGKTYTVIGIGESAFVNCVSITTISLPNTLKYINKEAFNLCLGLTTITIPQSVTSYGYDVFSLTSISEIKVLNPVPAEVPYNAFYYPQTNNNCVLYVPSGSAEAYRNAPEWNKFKKIVEMGKDQDVLNGHEYVDLSLPSGKCWATMNYGAMKAEDYGTYMEWSDNYVISSFWGSSWTTPSLADILELENYCTWKWSQKNGFNGYTITGNNGNSIFLPASGFMMIGQSSAMNVGSSVYYWSSTPSGEMAFIILGSMSDVWYAEMNTLYTKLPIRPITKDSYTNGIINVPNTTINSSLPVYDLMGRKVSSQKKGQLYIKNGRKYYVK